MCRVHTWHAYAQTMRLPLRFSSFPLTPFTRCSRCMSFSAASACTASPHASIRRMIAQLLTLFFRACTNLLFTFTMFASLPMACCCPCIRTPCPEKNNSSTCARTPRSLASACRIRPKCGGACGVQNAGEKERMKQPHLLVLTIPFLYSLQAVIRVPVTRLVHKVIHSSGHAHRTQVLLPAHCERQAP